MEKVQCMISNMRDGILESIVKRLLSDKNIQVREVSSGVDQLLSDEYAESGFLMTDMTNKDVPSEYKKILNNNREIIVVEFLNKCKSVCIYINDFNDRKF